MRRQTHPTRKVVIKQAAVDVLMVPVVAWLNSLDEVTTLYCCQGEPDDPDNRPYVLFTCVSPLQLITVLDTLGQAAAVEVTWSRDYPTLRYTARFGSREALAHVVERLHILRAVK